MPVCYLCLKYFDLYTGLFLHFKIVHNLRTDSTYRCREGLCRRDFQTINSFRKHVKNKHGTFQNECNISTSDNYSDTSSNFFNLSSSTNNTTNKRRDDFEVFEHILNTCVLQFIAKLYDNSTIPRNVIQLIVEETSDLFNSDLICFLKKYVIDAFESCSNCKERVSTTNTLFNKIQNPFKGLSSEYLRLKALSDTNFYIPPIEYKVGQTTVETIKDGNTILTLKDVTATFIPLRTVLKHLFELPEVFEKSLNFIKPTQTKNVRNFVHSEFWKRKALSFGNKTVFPLFMYYDDYESGNPLESHAGVHKIGAMYISLPFLPAHLQGCLDRILLFQLHHSKDRKTFGNKAIFEHLARELSSLEQTGICVKSPTGEQIIYFSLALIIGDNLGLHTILGFSESFSANFSCRFCKIHKSDLKNSCSQYDNLLRNRANYEADIKMNNVSLTGVKEPCVWNSVTFHSVENFSVDIMHDILEGVCHYDFLMILKRFVVDMKYFTLKNLNFRMKTFNYSGLESKNKPPLIEENFDFSNNIKFKMSASEMLCFTRYFGLFVGDLVPKADEGWQLYIILREIIDIIFSSSVCSQKVILLKVLITEHHEVYLSDIFKGRLKPKHHHMVHYPYIMSQVGPLKNLWSMRFESKHKESKTTANVTSSRRNITLTLSIKHQLKLCYMFLSKLIYDNKIVMGPGEIIKLDTLIHYDLFKSVLPLSLTESFLPHWVNMYGLVFKYSSVIITGSEHLLPTFGKLIHIIEIENKIAFIYNSFETIGFNEHYHAYEVKILKEYNFISYEDLLEPFQALCHKSVDGNMYIAVRHDIS